MDIDYKLFLFKPKLLDYLRIAHMRNFLVGIACQILETLFLEKYLF